MKLVFFSGFSGFTKRFIDKLDMPAYRIPLNSLEASNMILEEKYILITPTYGAGSKGFVPKQVIKFLNNSQNRDLLQGVVGTGNMNFGSDYCKAGEIIAQKCNVPFWYKLELSGTDEDIYNIRKGILEFWEIQK